MEVVGLNFSSATTPELILKTFEQYASTEKLPNGVILAPVQNRRWLVVFCDEINLPAADKYGTQKVISFLRQLVECGGYWRASDMSWVQIERIQFVGACNPPTILAVCHSATDSCVTHLWSWWTTQVKFRSNKICTYNRAVLKVVPTLRAYAEPLTDAMVASTLHRKSDSRRTFKAHYVYSPRELTRWVPWNL